MDNDTDDTLPPRNDRPDAAAAAEDILKSLAHLRTPAPDDNARKIAMNLAMAEFDDVQKDIKKQSLEKNIQKNKSFFQGLPFFSRPKDMSGQQADKPKRREKMNKKWIYGGLATAMVTVFAVATTMDQAPWANKSYVGLGGGLAGMVRQEPSSTQSFKNGLAKMIAPQEAKKEYIQELQSADMAMPAPSSAPVSGGAARTREADSMSLNSTEGLYAPSAKPQMMIAQMPDIHVPQGYKDVGRDKFEDVEENAIKSVTAEPVSTFSVDVDTASYAFIRKQIMNGVLPQKDAVRIEEMVNYFDYDYALPKDKDAPFQPSVTVTPSPWKDGNKLVHIGIKGYDIETKPRSNLVFLLDTSGSMDAADKLPLVKNSMKLLLDTLDEDDTVAIAVYAGSAGTVLEPTKVKDKAKILDAMNSLSAGGGTAGAQGIQLAYELAESNFDKDAVNRIILATDGDFNVGITNREELKDFVERKREKGVFLSVLGFGQGNLNDHMMQTLAQNGNGVAAYIDTLNEARKVLVEEATSALFPIAKDVKIQVEFNPATVAEYRLIGYETRALKREDFNNDKVDAGDIGSGHTVTAIYEVTPKGEETALGETRYDHAQGKDEATKAQAGKSDEYAFLKIRYKLPDEDTSRLIETPITDDRADISDQETEWASAVAGFGQLLKGGKYTGQFTYDDVITLAQKSKGEDQFGYRSEFIQIVRLAKSASEMGGQ